MVTLKRISVVFSLAFYLLATTAVHALHNHSTSECCCHDVHGFSCEGGDHHNDDAPGLNGLRHDAPPFHPAHCEDSCFACRFLAAKSIAPVAVAIIEDSEIVRLVDPPRPIFAPAARRDLPHSRGPPAI